MEEKGTGFGDVGIQECGSWWVMVGSGIGFRQVCPLQEMKEHPDRKPALVLVSTGKPKCAKRPKARV